MENELKKNKIAMFSIHSDPLAPLGSQEAGGQNVYIRSLVTELDKKGWSIDVFTRWDEAHKKSVATIGKRSKVIRLRGGFPKYIPKNQLLDLFPELYSNFLNAIDHKNPYCLFHGHYWDGGWMALEAHKQFKVPLIQNFHSLGQIQLQTKKQYQVNGKEAEVFEKRFFLEKEIIEKSSFIISLSETEKIDLQTIYGAPPEKLIVIPGGVNLKQFYPIEQNKAREITNFPKDAFILLYVGRMEWRKGIGTFISAVNLLKKDILNLRAIIVGGKIYDKQKNIKDFKEYQRLLKKTREEKVEDIVQFVGRIDHGRVPFFYSAANVFVIPSYYEPFGLVALEGMACKVPIIASEVGGLKTIIKEGFNGLLFKPRNPVDLKDKILKIYRSKELADNLTRNGYNIITKEYSWKNIAKKIEDIYKSLSCQPNYENSSSCSI